MSMSTHSGGAVGGQGVQPGQMLVDQAATSAMVEGRQVEMKRMRSFQEILAEEKEKRNILEIKLRRLNVTGEDGNQLKAKYLTFEEVSVLIFDILKINPDDCSGVALATSRYDTK